jgi:ADP-ribose pyrophosphatase YjhB (NUDIX family)
VIAPTHAGGVVVRVVEGEPRFLLVSARRQPDVWVLPKGHIDPGETAEVTAAREVLEEAGVVAELLQSLGVIEFDAARGRVRCEFFLMRYEHEGQASEDRRRAWLAEADASAALPFDDMRGVITAAAERLAGPRE